MIRRLFLYSILSYGIFLGLGIASLVFFNNASLYQSSPIIPSVIITFILMVIFG